MAAFYAKPLQDMENAWRDRTSLEPSFDHSVKARLDQLYLTEAFLELPVPVPSLHSLGDQEVDAQVPMSLARAWIPAAAFPAATADHTKFESAIFYNGQRYIRAAVLCRVLEPASAER